MRVSQAGDIIRILNTQGVVLVEYTYSAFGEVLSVTGSHASTLGQRNPFRYRGYYYDSETGFYYLNSRYYDPTVGRFLNADAYTSTGQGILGNNMFAYCGNNPVMRVDPNGYFSKVLEWIGDNILDPIEEGLSNIDLTYTYSVGLNISFLCFSVSGELGVSIDTKGNIAIQGTLGGDVRAELGFDISAYTNETITNAPSVEKLQGEGYFGGFTAKVALFPELITISESKQLDVIPDKKSNTNYYGYTHGMGIGGCDGTDALVGCAFFGGKSTTSNFFRLDFFDAYDACCSWVEWFEK